MNLEESVEEYIDKGYDRNIESFIVEAQEKIFEIIDKYQHTGEDILWKFMTEEEKKEVEEYLDLFLILCKKIKRLNNIKKMNLKQVERVLPMSGYRNNSGGKLEWEERTKYEVHDLVPADFDLEFNKVEYRNETVKQGLEPVLKLTKIGKKWLEDGSDELGRVVDVTTIDTVKITV